ncbi:DUF2721 domain-containing protein [Pedobacter puniceum]|uniref:DUF2721 domain-containing protein n=1 Tax=Pedobacter puniceum TaxID=2666136 RepID=A0A7K0FRZ7_9SPHI|nr:DUF2721 domain-containing protein [Pedobacter puniceum]MRX48779.1 DUF2721 domain-containing protein [Pedobacter puniceum]
MEFTLTTPALLFSAISLLLLAYTNRFLALASLVRSMKSLYIENKSENLLAQLLNLKKRIFLIRNMQGFGILSFFFCVLCMFLIYYNLKVLAQYVFGLSLFLLMISLFLSFREIQISATALKLELMDLENIKQKEK